MSECYFCGDTELDGMLRLKEKGITINFLCCELCYNSYRSNKAKREVQEHE